MACLQPCPYPEWGKGTIQALKFLKMHFPKQFLKLLLIFVSLILLIMKKAVLKMLMVREEEMSSSTEEYRKLPFGEWFGCIVNILTLIALQWLIYISFWIYTKWVS